MRRAFHRCFYAVMRVFVGIWAFLTGYRHDSYRPGSSQYLVLTNHNTNVDFLYFGLILKKHMYHVASEHIFRLGFLSRLIVFLADPIPRKKGASGDEAVRLIRERMARGDNVCMMAEGNRSFSGETGFISPKTAKLAKETGCGLITLRLHGGYLHSPRWSEKDRRGALYGEFVREYTAEELASMTEEEVYEAVCRDLYVNAYEDQEKEPRRYRTKAPAEHLESTLFTCPSCLSLSSMTSKKDLLSCRGCGYEVRYNEYGYFEKTDGTPLFDTVLGWFDWQLSYLKKVLPAALSEPDRLLSSDEDVTLARVIPGEGTEPVAAGPLRLYPDRLTFGEGEETVTIPVKSIEKISITLVNRMLLTADGVYYEARSDKPYSALKYLICSRLLAGKDYR